MIRIAFIYLILVLFAVGVSLPANCVRAESPQTEPLRVVIVGLEHGHASGFFSNSFHRTDINVVGIFEADREVAARYQAQYKIDQQLLFTDLESMLNATHPTAALVYTNTFDHRKVIETCAKHGVHVMVEKPLAVSVEDAKGIERAAKSGKIHVLVNYETTWYASNHAAIEIARSGAIGAIRKVVIHDGHQGPKEIGVQPEFLAWLTDPKLNGGGALFDFGCYGADLMTWMMDGKRPLSVTAVTQTFKPEIYRNVDDEANIILTYPNAVAIIQASWNWPVGRKDMEVYGQTGFAITVANKDLRIRYPNKAEEQISANPLATPNDDSINFLRAVISGAAKDSGPSSLETNIVVTEILDAARRSAQSGKTIDLGPKPPVGGR